MFMQYTPSPLPLDLKTLPATHVTTGGDLYRRLHRNFDRLEPALKQVFFIGDGMNNQKALQEFIVPPGATRFYLGLMDEKGWWWDNTGEIQTTALDANIRLVQ